MCVLEQDKRDQMTLSSGCQDGCPLEVLRRERRGDSATVWTWALARGGQGQEVGYGEQIP